MALRPFQAPGGRRLRAVTKRQNLRPMTSSEINDLGTRTYRTIAKHVLPLTFGPMSLCFAAIVFYQTFLVPAFFTTQKGTNVTAQFGEVVGAMAIAIFVATPLLILGLSYSLGPVIRLAGQVVMGDTVDVRGVERDGIRMPIVMANLLFLMFLRAFWLPFVGILLLAGSALIRSYSGEATLVSHFATLLSVGALGISFLLCPVLLSRCALAPVVAVLEGLGPGQSLARGIELNAKTRLATQSGVVGQLAFVLLFVFLAVSYGLGGMASVLGLPEMVASWAPIGAFGDLIRGIVQTLPAMLTLWLLAPFWGCVTTALYFDRRVKLEGLDIEVLAQDVLHADRQTALLN